jgi:hypothetical protein
MNIFVAKNEQKLGPYSVEEVRVRIGSGSFSGEDLGWHEGLTDWQPLSRLLASLPSGGEGPPQVPRKSSGLAKASFIIAMVGIGAWLVLVAAAAVAVRSGVDEMSLLMVIIGLGMFIVMAANLVGIIFGFIALPKPVSNKWMAVAGLTANGVELLGVVFLFVLGLAQK